MSPQCQGGIGVLGGGKGRAWEGVGDSTILTTKRMDEKMGITLNYMVTFKLESWRIRPHMIGVYHMNT